MTPSELRAMVEAATDAPWRVSVEAGEEWWFSANQAVIRPPGDPWDSVAVLTCERGLSDEDPPADAALIALVPDLALLCAELAEALELAWAWLLCFDDEGPEPAAPVTDVRAALASLERLGT